MRPATHRVEKISATDAKNRFGEVLEKVAADATVSLIKHGKPAAYVISPERYERYQRQLQVPAGPIEALQAEFETMVARMQAAPSIEASASLMTLSTQELRGRVRKSPSKGLPKR